MPEASGSGAERRLVEPLRRATHVRGSIRSWRTPLLSGLAWLLLVLSATWSDSAAAKVFIGQKQALAEAFPDATRIERKTRILRPAEVEQIEARARETLESKIVVLHTAYRDDEVLGYARIDVHNVRTQPEAFLVAINPDGRVRSVRVLAFHEPLDYLPTDRWYQQFKGKGRADALRVGRDVHGVVGATLSARAATQGVRRMLAFWEVLLSPDPADAGAPADATAGAADPGVAGKVVEESGAATPE